MHVLSPGLAALLAAALLPSAGAAEPAPLRYNRDIRPILSDNCFQCHGPDKAQLKGKLRLDKREVALERKAFVPGKPDESELVHRIFTDDPDDQMPPAEAHKHLTADQKQMLRRWIAEGAVYEAHWAYLPIQRPPVPNASGPAANDKIRNPIDAFVVARLDAAGLDPAPEADRRTLLRRLSLDLIGLPPSPSQADAFVQDSSPHAYEREVERLLASSHFGERMAVPWLDAVRFADTVGYHGDQNQRIFPYRDYVIEAFNANKPFDRFTLEQIAGDLLPNPSPEQLTASGFNRLNMVTREGGAQPDEYIAKYQADRVRTVSTAWLGSTMACCECHDHKFDPFTTRDFYSMEAFFADLKQWGVYSDYDYTPNPDLKGWSNDHPFPPEIRVESPYLEHRLADLKNRERNIVTTAAARVEADPDLRQGFDLWREDTRAFLRQRTDGWLTPRVQEAKSRSNGKDSATEAATQSDGSVLFASDKPGTDRLTLELPSLWLAAIRLELLAPPSGSGLFRGDRSVATVQLKATLRHAGTQDKESLRFVFADADAKDPRYSGGHEIQGIAGGWKLHVDPASSHEGIWILERPRRVSEGDVLDVLLSGDPAARVRVSVSPLAIEPSRWKSGVADFARGMEEDSRDALDLAAALYFRSTGCDGVALADLRSLDPEIRACHGGRAWTLVSEAVEPRVTRVLPRGNWMDHTGAVVEPATPGFLPALATSESLAAREGKGDSDPAHSPPGRRLTRLDLAKWLVWKKNPLTARNYANRLWALFFGSGLSARLEDLGLQGDWPTHPELLDWLAAEFMDPSVQASPEEQKTTHPWDIKHLVRLLVNSATYRQASVPSQRDLEVDPENRLLSRQTPRRLDAEFVRDNALAISGVINLDVGGPSVFPYQPAGYYANLQFPDRDYVANKDGREYRRGVYMHWQRTFLHPMLANFDAPSREECVAARILSNTPQQALTLLNDPTFVEASRVLAASVVYEKHRDADRIDRLFEKALLRAPRPEERDSLESLLADLRKTYTAAPADAEELVHTGLAPVPKDVSVPELAAWANIARVVMNLHETITRY